MAGSPVRELIVKFKFQADKSSESKANKTISNLKEKLKSISSKATDIKVKLNTSAANNALAQLRNKIAGLNLTASVKLKAQEKISGIKSTFGNRSLRGSFGGSGGRLAAVGDSIGSAVAMYGGYMGVSQIKQTADEMMNMDGRLRAVTKDEAERLRLESELYAMGQKTRQQMTSLAELYTGIARTSNKMGYSMNQNMRVAETVSKALIVGGASKQASSAVILQLSQALGSGVLQGDELHSLDENASFLMEHVAAYFGTTIGGLKKLGSEGKITSDMLLEALTYASTAIDKEFEKMPITFGQAMTVLENSWDKFILGVEQKSTVFSTIAAGMAKGFEGLSGKLNDVFTLMGTPDPNKMVTITDAATGEEKQITEQQYYDQKAAENPELVTLVETLKNFAEWLDELDGKTGNIKDQIAEWTESFMTVAAVLLPIVAILGTISGLIALFTPLFSLVAGLITGVLIPVLSTLFSAIVTVVSFLVATFGGPVVAVIALVVAAIIGLIVYWDELKAFAIEAVTAIMEWCINAADTIASAFGEKINAVKGFFTDLKTHALQVVDEIVTAISEWLGGKIEWAKGALSDLKSFASSAVDYVLGNEGSSSTTNYNQTNYVSGYTAGEASSYVASSMIFDR